jgi:hypothetical protein
MAVLLGGLLAACVVLTQRTGSMVASSVVIDKPQAALLQARWCEPAAAGTSSLAL